MAPLFVHFPLAESYSSVLESEIALRLAQPETSTLPFGSKVAE